MIRPRSFLEIVVKMPALCVFVAMSGGVVGGNLFSKLLRLFGLINVMTCFFILIGNSIHFLSFELLIQGLHVDIRHNVKSLITV